MTPEQITELARQAGFVGMDGEHKTLCRFAELVESTKLESTKRIIWKACSMYGKTGEVVYTTIKAMLKDDEEASHD